MLARYQGIGETGTAIFCREVQVVWPEFYASADQACAPAAKTG